MPTVLDADGEPLLRGLAARPAVVKPNLAELSAAVGRRLTGTGGAGRAAVAAAALELRQAGAQAVVVSLGARGLLAVTEDGVWQAAHPGAVAANPTGAGDAVVAGSPTTWCSATPGPNGCGTRSRSAPRRPPRRSPASSAGPTTSRRWARSRSSGGTA